MNSRMISEDPSKIRLMRMSRSSLLGGHAALAARGEGRGGLITAAAADLHQLVRDLAAPFPRQYSLASAASMRMSLRLSSASWLDSSTTASSA